MTAPLVLSFLPQTDPCEIVVQALAGQREVFRTRFFCRTGQSLRPAPEALFCLGIYPASEIGAALRIDGGVDSALLARADQITGLYRSWWPGCRRVDVHAEAAPAQPEPDAANTALFFSGGVDSCFSLASAEPRLTALVTLLGVDVSLSDGAGTDRLEAMAHEVARDKGLEPIVIETDVRRGFHPFASWIEHHGSALASIGHLLSEHIGQVLIASSGDDAAWDVPWGSHPGLDPMFSSGRLSVEHHGLALRFDKIARIADDTALMRHLRVCNITSHNCGVCDKCTFAMRSLDILDAQDQAVTFPPFKPLRGKLKIVDDACLGEFLRLRQAASQAGRIDLLPQIDETIAAYRKGSIWNRLGSGGVRSRARVMRHRLRWRRVSS